MLISRSYLKYGASIVDKCSLDNVFINDITLEITRNGVVFTENNVKACEQFI